MNDARRALRPALAAAILACLGASGFCEAGAPAAEALRAGSDGFFASLDAGAAGLSPAFQLLKRRGPGLAEADFRREEGDKYNSLIWDRKYRGDWFEWWYYKVVVPGTEEAFYFCYGVVNPWDLDRTRPASRSYVSMGSFAAGGVVEQALAPGAFAAASDRTLIRVGDNTATDRELKGRLRDKDGAEVSWDLRLEKDWGWNAMGWAMYQDWLMNIYWYPAQASAFMSGTITFKGRTIALDRAPAYQDRNWGKSFPKWWTWLVSNHFKDAPGTVLATGGGLPKVLGHEIYEGVTVGLRHQGKEYTFRPNDGDIVKVDVRFGKWEVSARNRRHERIEISAFAPREKFMLLKFTTPQGPVFHDYEALKGRIRVKLYRGSSLAADLETDEGGIEFGSHEPADFESLFSSEKRIQ